MGESFCGTDQCDAVVDENERLRALLAEVDAFPTSDLLDRIAASLSDRNAE